MRLWYIVEREHAVAQLEKEVCAETDQSPDRQLGEQLAVKSDQEIGVAYDGNDVVLDLGW